MTTWVYESSGNINWIPGVKFTSENTNGSSYLTWEVKSIYPDNLHVELTLPNQDNKTNSILQKYPLTGLKGAHFWFHPDTIKPIDPMLKIINKIKYLDKRFLDRQTKKVLA